LGLRRSRRNVLSISLLTDALDGDVVLASAHARDFRDEFVYGWPMDAPFVIRKADILEWLSTRGVGAKAGDAARREIDARRSQFERRGQKLLEPWERVRTAGGLVTQRFDLVPADFEAGLVCRPDEDPSARRRRDALFTLRADRVRRILALDRERALSGRAVGPSRDLQPRAPPRCEATRLETAERSSGVSGGST
jgi:hypothetical protein